MDPPMIKPTNNTANPTTIPMIKVCSDVDVDVDVDCDVF
jgi:hypothetical protein